MIATGITGDGGREVLGVMVGDSETEVYWTQFLRSLRERGLGGVRLVLGDHHAGLGKAIRKVMIGATFQHWRVHFRAAPLCTVPVFETAQCWPSLQPLFSEST
ncbi:transposase [Streptomyces sp. NPDC056291]|uniref:transposase n=1 Tax=unclassified Streptomyces TaxID=2593676 RepID=UPI0035E36C3A